MSKPFYEWRRRWRPGSDTSERFPTFLSTVARELNLVQNPLRHLDFPQFAIAFELCLSVAILVDIRRPAGSQAWLQAGLSSTNTTCGFDSNRLTRITADAVQQLPWSL